MNLTIHLKKTYFSIRSKLKKRIYRFEFSKDLGKDSLKISLQNHQRSRRRTSKDLRVRPFAILLEDFIRLNGQILRRSRCAKWYESRYEILL
jgi:hypothetical protein